MINVFYHLAFIGPGGPEFIMIMLVLLVMFGAKDAPRILRKLNEFINQIRNTADGFKREVMYGDLNNDKPSFTPSESDDDPIHDDGYDYDTEEDYYSDSGDEESSNEVFESFEEDLKDEDLKDEDLTETADSEVAEEEDDDAPKT
jgi:Sec-independent protein translocase protein TatA